MIKDSTESTHSREAGNPASVKTTAGTRVSKYLLYAIGEIVLVVIGILIALQINTANEHRKNKNQVENYTVNLINDLRLDSLKINESLIGLRGDSVELSGYQERMAKETATVDTLIHIARFDYQYLIWIHTGYNKDTYEVLTQTGDIGLLDQELIAELNALSNLQEIEEYARNQTFESYRNNARLYSQKYPTPYQGTLIQEGTPISDALWSQISPMEHATAFNTLIVSKSDSYRLSLRYLPQVLESTNELLAKLRSQ